MDEPEVRAILVRYSSTITFAPASMTVKSLYKFLKKCLVYLPNFRTHDAVKEGNRTQEIKNSNN